MHFILQKDNVTLVEKRAIQQACMLMDGVSYSTLSLDAIATSDIPKEHVPVGTVEFVTAVALKHNITLPQHLSYPECLRTPQIMCRVIWEGQYGDVAEHLFVKPRFLIKHFTGALRRDIKDEIEDTLPVYISELISFLSEWRFYILNGEVIGSGRYDDGDDDLPAPDIGLVQASVAAMSATNVAPVGYTLDFGVLADGRTALVEANDGFSVGYYRGNCSHQNFAKLLHARWIEIIQCQ